MDFVQELDKSDQKDPLIMQPLEVLTSINNLTYNLEYDVNDWESIFNDSVESLSDEPTTLRLQTNNETPVTDFRFSTIRDTDSLKTQHQCLPPDSVVISEPLSLRSLPLHALEAISFPANNCKQSFCTYPSSYPVNNENVTEHLLNTPALYPVTSMASDDKPFLGPPQRQSFVIDLSRPIDFLICNAPSNSASTLQLFESNSDDSYAPRNELQITTNVPGSALGREKRKYSWLEESVVNPVASSVSKRSKQLHFSKPEATNDNNGICESKGTSTNPTVNSTETLSDGDLFTTASLGLKRYTITKLFQAYRFSEQYDEPIRKIMGMSATTMSTLMGKLRQGVEGGVTTNIDMRLYRQLKDCLLAGLRQQGYQQMFDVSTEYKFVQDAELTSSQKTLAIKLLCERIPNLPMFWCRKISNRTGAKLQYVHEVRTRWLKRIAEDSTVTQSFNRNDQTVNHIVEELYKEIAQCKQPKDEIEKITKLQYDISSYNFPPVEFPLDERKKLGILRALFSQYSPEKDWDQKLADSLGVTLKQINDVRSEDNKLLLEMTCEEQSFVDKLLNDIKNIEIEQPDSSVSMSRNRRKLKDLYIEHVMKKGIPSFKDMTLYADLCHVEEKSANIMLRKLLSEIYQNKYPELNIQLRKNSSNRLYKV